MNQSEILVNILLGRPLSCKLKGRPFVVVVVRLSSAHFHGCTVAERCKTEHRLLLITNRKSCWLSNYLQIIDFE